MSLISLVVTLIVVGVLLWLVTTYIPMDPTIKKIITIVVIVACVLYVLGAFGVLGDISTVQVPRIN